MLRHFCASQALPGRDGPASHPGGAWPYWRTVYDVADGWHKSGATGKMHDELHRQCRIAAGRTPEPTAAVIDSQSVRAAKEVSRASRGYDAGKKVNGRKRHIAVDTIGLLLTVLVTAAGVQDRDGAKPLLWNLRRASPRSSWPGLTRLRRQARHLGQDHAQDQAEAPDRQAAR